MYCLYHMVKQCLFLWNMTCKWNLKMQRPLLWHFKETWTFSTDVCHFTLYVVTLYDGEAWSAVQGSAPQLIPCTHEFWRHCFLIAVRHASHVHASEDDVSSLDASVPLLTQGSMTIGGLSWPQLLWAVVTNYACLLYWAKSTVLWLRTHACWGSVQPFVKEGRGDNYYLTST